MMALTIVSTVLAAAAAAFACLVSLIVYRLLLHPLAKIPGPKLAALTDYWELYQDFFRGQGGYLYLELNELHRRYGPIIRIRPNEVHVKDSEWMSELYTGSLDPRDRDPRVFNGIGVPQSTLGTCSHELHRVRRAAIEPFFTQRALKGLDPFLREKVALFRNDFKTHVGEIIELRCYILAWTTDSITDLLFGKRFNLFWNPPLAAIHNQTLVQAAGHWGLIKLAPWLLTTSLQLPLVFWRIVLPRLAEYVNIYKELGSLAQTALDAWRAEKHGDTKKPKSLAEGSIFDVMLSSKLPLEQKLPSRMSDEVSNLMIAGSFSPSKTMAPAVFHILENPQIHADLHEELKNACPDPNSIPELAILQRLPLLSAIVKEALRITVIVNTRIPLKANHKALHYKSYLLPPGTSVSMTLCDAAFDEAIFPSPHVFRPQRWLDGTQKLRDFDHYVLPFGRGSRVCLGKDMALAQIYFLIATLFRTFDLELYDTFRERDINIKGGGPLGEASVSSPGIRVRIKGVFRN